MDSTVIWRLKREIQGYRGNGFLKKKIVFSSRIPWSYSDLVNLCQETKGRL